MRVRIDAGVGPLRRLRLQHRNEESSYLKAARIVPIACRVEHDREGRGAQYPSRDRRNFKRERNVSTPSLCQLATKADPSRTHCVFYDCLGRCHGRDPTL